jgi:recombination protein RecA
MPKRKKEEIDEINDNFIDLSDMGGVMLDEIRPKYFVDTGNLAINYICSGKFIGGGIPGGKITEIYGPPAGSKSLLTMCVLHGCQQLNGVAIALDLERAINRDFVVAAARIDSKRLYVFEPDTIEETFAKITNVIKRVREKLGSEIPIVFMYDSLTAVPCDRELRENDLPDGEFTDAQYKAIVGAKEQPGERAKAINKGLRKINGLLSKQNATLVVINQVRQKIGVMFGSDETTPGGKALEFYASCRLRVAPQKQIIKKLTDKYQIPIGVNVQLKNKKNRSFSPHWETDNIQLYFESGINPLGGLLGVLIKAERVKPVGAGRYVILEPWAGGKEIKFQSSQERNDVPVDTLFECPALVDANDKSEIKDYLSAFGNAIDISKFENVTEEDIVDEDKDLMTFMNKNE